MNSPNNPLTSELWLALFFRRNKGTERGGVTSPKNTQQESSEALLPPSSGRLPGGPLASGVSKATADNDPSTSPLSSPELRLPKPFTMPCPSSHLVLCKAGSTGGIIVFPQMGKCRLREGQCRPQRCTASGRLRQVLPLLSAKRSGASQQTGASPHPGRRLLFLGVLSLNPAPLSCLHSPRGTLALRSPFPPSEIVSISPTPPRIVGSGPCLLPRVLVLRSLCGPTFPPRPAWLADASSGPQDSVGEGDGHLQKTDPRSSFLKLFCTEEPHGISVKNSDSWAPDIEPVGLGTFYTVAWSDSDPGVGTTV